MNHFTRLLIFAFLLLASSFFHLRADALTTPCPQKLDFDDPSWALVSVGPFINNNQMWVRKFFYQKDPVLRVGKPEKSGCFGHAISFVINGREERVALGMYDIALQFRAYYLKTEDGEWRKGSLAEAKSVYVQGKQPVLSLTLYDEVGREIAKRSVVIPELQPLRIFSE